MLTGRRLLAGTLSAIAAPLVADGQSTGRLYRLGILSLGASLPGQPDRPTSYWTPFIDEMRALKYEQGRNLVIRYAGANAKPERRAALAAELVKSEMGALVTTGPRETLAARAATASIPIVMTLVPDPIEAGLIASLRGREERRGIGDARARAVWKVRRASPRIRPVRQPIRDRGWPETDAGASP